MRPARRLSLASVVLFAAAAAGCKDSGITDPPGDPPPDPVQLHNLVQLRSDPGDYIGGGRNYEYTEADAIITVTSLRNQFTVRIHGDQRWTGDFFLPSTLSRLVPGSYSNLTRYPFHNPTVGGLSWSGEGRGCNTLTGSVTVDSVTYAGDELTAILFRFVQHCENGTSALRGTVRWRPGNPSAAPGPVNPIPTSLWRPAAGATPASGNYVYLRSDAGDYIGQGRTYTYAGNRFSASANGGHLSVSVREPEWWNGDFRAMNTLNQLQVGYYPDLRRYPFHNPVKGGLSWSGEGRGCNQLTGWFAIDRVTYAADRLTAIELRFEQRCESGTAALRGAIRWSE